MRCALSRPPGSRGTRAVPRCARDCMYPLMVCLGLYVPSHGVHGAVHIAVGEEGCARYSFCRRISASACHFTVAFRDVVVILSLFSPTLR